LFPLNRSRGEVVEHLPTLLSFMRAEMVELRTLVHIPCELALYRADREGYPGFFPDIARGFHR
jgi:hypothetical protein